MDTLQFVALFILVSAIYFRLTAVYRAVLQDDDSAIVMSVVSVFLFAIAFGLLVFSVMNP